MIGSIKGTVELLDNPYAIINVGGVGYRVLLYNSLLSGIKLNEDIKLYIHTHVKEDALDLFGFSSLEDLKLFENLISVSGVGPKTASSLFSHGSRAEIVEAIIKGNVDFFTSVPRLGKKNAQKIIIELKNKMGSLEDLDLSEEGQKINGEVIAALKSFGFSAKEALDAAKAIKDQGETIADKIKLALKQLGK
jgi:holliday junction DNA helicase RuvA